MADMLPVKTKTILTSGYDEEFFFHSIQLLIFDVAGQNEKLRRQVLILLLRVNGLVWVYGV
jgi:hypothetical protein